MDLVRDIIRAFSCETLVDSTPFPTSLNTKDQNSECPTSMRVGNITPAAEIPCHDNHLNTLKALILLLTNWDP